MDLLAIHNSAETVAARTTGIFDTMLRPSPFGGAISGGPQIRDANFTIIAPADLRRMFDLYDREFFGGWLAATVQTRGGDPILFRLSTTMTRAGGKTIVRRHRLPDKTCKWTYEIAIAARLLFMTFKDIQRTVVVSGLTCVNRLQALQRIMEHEAIHLAELLAWDESSCSALRFKMLAKNIFGHAGTKHALVTPYEQAVVQHGISVGSMVAFTFDGVRLVGRVNRIHHRATVLVEAGDGRRYTDGKHYHKYYIPLPQLQPATDPPPSRRTRTEPPAAPSVKAVTHVLATHGLHRAGLHNGLQGSNYDHKIGLFGRGRDLHYRCDGDVADADDRHIRPGHATGGGQGRD